MRRWQVAVAGIVIGIILLIAGVPWWAPVLIILAALAVPVVGYAMLDSSQRGRVRRIRRRQIGR
jgi:cell division protein FtsW (lipid II flippase)